MNCCNCPYRSSCANAKPPCYVPAPYYPYVPYVPVYPFPYMPTYDPWYWHTTGGTSDYKYEPTMTIS